MKCFFECPIDFIDMDPIIKEFNISITVDNSAEVIVLNPGTDRYYDAEYFTSFPNLKWVLSPSTGVNHFDTEWLSSNSISYRCLLDNRKVLDTIHASAEYTWLHIMNAFRKFSIAIDPLYIQAWRELSNEQALRSNELHGKTLVIIGYGRIGKKIYKYAKAFGMDVRWYDPHINSEFFDINLQRERIHSLDELTEINPDALSINCYLTPETTNMIDGKLLKGLKDKLIVVNTSRGEVVNESDILDLVKQGKIIFATDVLQGEQKQNDLQTSSIMDVYRKYDNLIITPHVAGATLESQTKALRGILECLR
jgi:D-3-phosphoglycerate dehydrogenase|tara:strand:+ start:2517 stop:3443 length:927 start_codon:yes stop_codon:yes gene_type:complete